MPQRATPAAAHQPAVPAVRQPAAPAAPLPPEQLPASPPEVQFSRGQLTITAANSTLGDILRDVRKQTGASVDVPANATERVVGQFGPGPARDVLTSLLNGSHFNYLLLGSADNPYALDRVILTSKTGGPSEPPAQQASATNPSNQFVQPPVAYSQNAEAQDTSNDDSISDVPDSADAASDDQSNQADDEQQQQQGQPFGQPGGVKTPEQLLQELQQRQQQMQQQMQQQPGGVPPQGFPTPQPPPRQP